MLRSITTCDGCGDLWPGQGNGGTPPGLLVEILIEGAGVTGRRRNLHVCSLRCLAAYCDLEIKGRKVRQLYDFARKRDIDDPA